jgi:hypothetical protein
MPLRDHFQPPLSLRRHWESFHSWLATSIAGQLNQTLPRRFVAELHLHLGSQVEADIVTSRYFNLHDELLPLLGLDSTYAMPNEATLYTVAYRPIRRGEANVIDAWPVVLSIGAPLPVLPLALRRFRPVPLDLEAAYEDACRRSRV